MELHFQTISLQLNMNLEVGFDWTAGHSLSNLLGDGVLHLEAGVDLNEVVLALFVHQELHGPGILIAHLENTQASNKTC